MPKTAQKCSEGNTVTSEQNTRRGRNFCFTDFRTAKPVFDNTIMKYLCFAPEVCPTTQKPHWQSYVYWIHPKTLTSTAKYFGKSHTEFQNGTSEEAIKYCEGPYEKNGKSKPLNPLFEEFGDRPSQGARTDLNTMRDDILGGKRVDDILMEDPLMYHQYGRTLEKMEDIANRKKFRNFMTKGLYYYGPTGVGKSKKVFEDFHPDTHYVVNLRDVSERGWWNGYKGQPIVIINEFRGQITFGELMDIVDMHPFSVCIRGRDPHPFLAKEVRITSSVSPEECYINKLSENDNFKQFHRRFEVIHLHTPLAPPSSEVDKPLPKGQGSILGHFVHSKYIEKNI